MIGSGTLSTAAWLTHCRQMVARPAVRAEYLQTVRRRRPLAGYVSNYIPVEIVAAAGFCPVRIIGRLAGADAHGRSLYTPVCGFARDVFAAAEVGAFAEFDSVIFPNACDALRVLGQQWPSVPTAYDLAHPIAAADGAVDCFAVQLRQLAEFLGRRSGCAVTVPRLTDEIARSNQTRRLLRKLYDRPDCLSGSDRIALVTAALMMDRDDANAMLQQVLDEAAPAAATGGKRILLVGPLVDNLELLTAIEQRGAVIADDDITNGRRCMDRDVETEGDPYRNLARRYLYAAPSPTLSTRVDDDRRAFDRRMAEVKPDGLLYLNQKFCEPHVHNYLSKKEFLSAMNIPVLMLEVEHAAAGPSERDLLRIESFIETIGGR